MSMDIDASPLSWPLGWERTASGQRQRSRFDTSFAAARDGLIEELRLMGVGRHRVVLSTNIPLRRDGLPYANTRHPEDPGVAEKPVTMRNYGRMEGQHKDGEAVLVTPLAVIEPDRRSDMSTVRVPLSRGKYALIDEADAERVNAYKWYALDTGRTRQKTYAARNIQLPNGKRTTQYLHRFLMDAPSGIEVDHWNGDGLDCRRENMRIASRLQNTANVPKSPKNTSGYIGVSWDSARALWVAQIQVKGRHVFLGRFVTPEEAAKARASYAHEIHGEFASRDEVSHV